jgi:hypothetical protein
MLNNKYFLRVRFDNPVSEFLMARDEKIHSVAATTIRLFFIIYKEVFHSQEA